MIGHFDFNSFSKFEKKLKILNPKRKHIIIKKQLVFLIAFFLYSSKLYSQSVYVKNFRIENGLLSNQVYESIVDKNGFLWICSDAGIQKYNGSKFINFNEENGLFDAVVLSIYEDFEGKIWFNTINQRIGYIKNNKVYYLKLKLPKHKVPNYYNSISVDENKELWIGSFGKGLILSSKFPYKSFKIHQKNENYVRLLKNKQFVYSFNDNPWDYGKTNYWKIQNRKLISTIKLSKKCLSKNRLFSTDNKGNYVIYDSNELVLFQKNKEVYRTKDLPRIFFLRLLGNQLSIGTENQGLKIYIWKNNRLDLSKEYLKTESVTSCCLDKQNGLWISTLNNGLFFQPSPHIRKFNKNNQVESFVYVSKDSLLLFDKSGKFISNIKTNERIHYKNGSPPKIHPLKKNTLVISGYEAGYLNTNTLKKELIYENNRPVFINDFLFSDNREFAITRYSFIEVIESKHLKRIFNNKEIIYSVTIDENNKGFWICQNGQITFLDRQLKIKKILKNFTKKEIKTNKAVCDKYGQLWISTNGEGLICFDNKGKKTSHLTSIGGRFCNELILKNENLWINSREGLVYMNVKTKQVKSIPLINKLIGKEIKQLNLHNNKLYILSKKGFYVLSTDIFKSKTQANTIYIEKTNFYSKVENSNLSILKNNNNLSIIEYNTINFNKLNKDVFYTRLIPIQNNWTKTEEKSIRFTDLPEDDYIFEVKTDANKIKRIYFHIEEPFYQSTTFLIFILVCISSLLLSGIWFIRNRQLKKIIQKKNIQILISELESKALRSQMNPHFIFNCLNSIQNFLYTDKSEKAIEFLGKFSVLIRKVLEQSTSELTTLENEIELLNLYIQLEQLRQNGKFDFQITSDPAIQQSVEKIPSMLIQPFVENAILHGLNPLKERRGHLLITFTKKPDGIIAIIQDNGVGRNANKKRKNHTSMGIKITEERINNISRIHGKKAEYEIVDGFDSNNQATGTKVILTIPNI